MSMAGFHRRSEDRPRRPPRAGVPDRRGVRVAVLQWRDRPPTARQRRRAHIDALVKASFDNSGGSYGSPRVLDDLREAGERVSKKTVEASIVRQGLVARTMGRRHDRDPHRRGQVVPGHRRRPVLPADGRLRSQRAPRRGAGPALRSMSRWPCGAAMLRRRVPYRPSLDLHRGRLHRGVHQAGDRPVDGPGSARASITPRPSPYSRPSSTSCSPVGRSSPGPRPAGRSPSSSTATTPARRHSAAARRSPVDYKCAYASEHARGHLGSDQAA